MTIKTYTIREQSAHALPTVYPPRWAQRLVEAAQEPVSLRMHKIDAIIDQMYAAGLLTAPRAKWLSDGLKLAHETKM